MEQRVEAQAALWRRKMVRSRRVVCLGLGLVLLVAGVLATWPARVRAQEDPIKWSFGKVPPKAAAGDAIKVELAARIEEGWHLYSITQPPPPIATRISVPAGQPFSLNGAIDGPAPTIARDENFGIDAEYYAGTASFTLPIKVQAGAAGKQTLKVQAYYQTCNDQFCLPPKTVSVEAAIDLGGSAAAALPEPAAAQPAAGAAPAAPPAAVPPPTGQPAEAVTPSASGAPASGAVPPAAASLPPAPATETPSAPAPSGAAPPAAAPAAGDLPGGEEDLRNGRSLLSFIWLAMTVGALTLLTPCVFPMVPITVSYFTKHAAGDRKKAVGQAVTYMAGIILTFTALGMALALLVGATSLNRFAANPWINILITGVFVVFALNLFGVFELQMPSGLVNRLDSLTRKQGGSQTLATLLMGLTFTLTSFTCTAPFIGTLLVMAAGGDWQWPLLGMLAFSTVFALPFFVLALMPQWMANLPRSGGWLNSVKVMMAFLEIAAALKFISNVDLVWGWGLFTRDVVLAMWVVIAALMVVYILGLITFPHDSKVKRLGAVRIATAVASAVLGVWLASGLLGRSLGELEAFLPPPTGSGITFARALPEDELPWIMNDYEQALARAKAEHKRVFLDFTGYTCTNCRWMESNMFPLREVRRELEQYVLVRLYTDGEGEIYQRQQAIQQTMFKTVALPYYAVVDADGKPVVSFPGLTRDPAKFIAFLQRGLPAD